MAQRQFIRLLQVARSGKLSFYAQLRDPVIQTQQSSLNAVARRSSNDADDRRQGIEWAMRTDHELMRVNIVRHHQLGVESRDFELGLRGQ